MDQSKLKSVAWDELYKVFSEQMDEDKVGLMESVLHTVEHDVLEVNQVHSKQKKIDPRKYEIVQDGFGSVWSAYCPMCGKKTMHVVRPGKVQCSNCD